MPDPVLSAFKMNLGYAGGLIDNVPAERTCEQPAPGVNHPAWLLGHLTLAGSSLLKLLGAPQPLPEGWNERFGMASSPDPDPARYPAWEELVERFFAVHRAVAEAYPNADPAALSAANTAVLPDALPTVHDLAGFLMTVHLSIHLGQFSTWRRVVGIEPVRIP